MDSSQRQQEPSIEQDRLLDHRYDGIQEYDNLLPRWWVTIFWATIIFSVFYITYYHFGPGPLDIEKYDAQMIAFYDQQAQELLALGEITNETLEGLKSNESMMSGAKKIYQAKCATCHGVFAEGGIGPNLTDQYWLHGGQLADIYNTVNEGVPEKGMLAWNRQLRPAELMAVAAYVDTLLGSSPPNAKAPQGELFEAPGDEVPAEPSSETEEQTSN
jgi:cytochrome c oxidase cbb3-type subunit 3